MCRRVLALAVDRLADIAFNRALSVGAGRRAQVRNLFARQAIPMMWDFAEASSVRRCRRVAATVTVERVAKVMRGDNG